MRVKKPTTPETTTPVLTGDAPMKPPMSGLVARDGDVLVVSYPEVTIPIRQYSNVKVGGLIYTRKLVAGEDVGEQYADVYAFLRDRAEKDAVEKVKLWAAELGAAR